MELTKMDSELCNLEASPASLLQPALRQTGDAERSGQFRAAHAGVVDRGPGIEEARACERPHDHRLEPRVPDQTRGRVERRGVVARERDPDAVSGAMRLRL